jgi:hypothetical protein
MGLPSYNAIIRDILEKTPLQDAMNMSVERLRREATEIANRLEWENVVLEDEE